MARASMFLLGRPVMMMVVMPLLLLLHLLNPEIVLELNQLSLEPKVGKRNNSPHLNVLEGLLKL